MSMAHLYRTLRMCALQRRRGSDVVIRTALFKPGSQPNVLFKLGSSMKNIVNNKRLAGASLVVAALGIAAGASFLSGRNGSAQAEAAAAAPAAVPVSVSVVVACVTEPW